MSRGASKSDEEFDTGFSSSDASAVSYHKDMAQGRHDFYNNEGSIDVEAAGKPMISNSSLRRSRVLASGSCVGSDEPQESQEEFSKGVKRPSLCRICGQIKGSLCDRGGSAAKMGSELMKRLLVAAIVTLIYEAVCGHILEFFKVVMQTTPTGTSYLDALRAITAEKGIVALWDGFVPWGVLQAVSKGGVFGLAHAMATSLLKPLVEKGILPEIVALTLAGGIAGGFQGYVLSPLLLLKTRVMTNPVFRDGMSLSQTTLLSVHIGAEVVSKEGVSALMKGANVFSLKRVFDWATRYYFSDVIESMIRNYKGGLVLSAQLKIIASLLGGTVSTFSTVPLDVLVTKTQDAKKAGVTVSAWKLFQDDLEDKGWAGMYDAYMRGFEARLLHVCFTTVVMKVFSPLVYDAVFKTNHER